MTVALLRARLAGLVVGRAERTVVALDEIDRAAQLDAAVELHRLVDAVGSRSRRSVRPKESSKSARRPLGLLGGAPQPLAQVGADRRDAVVPHALDRRRRARPCSCSATSSSTSSSPRARVERCSVTGTRPCVAQRFRGAELHLVDERPALQRVELLDRLRLFARRELCRALQEEPVRARGEVLERGRRERARVEAVRRERGSASSVGIDQAVGRLPRLEPAPRAEAQRAREVRVGSERG